MTFYSGGIDEEIGNFSMVIMSDGGNQPPSFFNMCLRSVDFGFCISLNNSSKKGFTKLKKRCIIIV